MKWLVVALGAFGCLLPCARSRAAIDSSELPRVTLSQAVAYARERRPELRADRARVASVEAQAEVVRARWYPVVGATAQVLAATTNNTTSSYLPSLYFDNPRVSATRAESPSTMSLAPSGSSLVGVGARQELFDFGRLAARAATEDLRADAARSSLDARRLAVDYDVEESYFAVYAAKSILTAAQMAVQRSAAHRDMARAGVDSGLRRRIELTRAEAVVDRYELEEIDGRRGVTVAESALAAAVGASEPLLDIDGTPPASGDLPDLSESFSRAKSRNPDLHAALLRIRAQEMHTRAVGDDARPNLLLTGAISANAGGASPSSGASAPVGGWLPSVPNWDVGVVLSWPLFDETVAARTKQSELDEDEARADADAASLHVVAEVQQAYVQVEAARDRLPVLRQAQDAAVANYDQASARFNVGLGNAIEIADAEDLRTEADIQLALGTFELARARAALARAVAEGL